VLAARDRQVRELEAMFAQLCENNAAIHEKGQKYIDTLEARLAELQTREQQQSAAYEKLDSECRLLKRTIAVRAPGRLSRLFSGKRSAARAVENPPITAGMLR
jgi:hypothetical protein